ncbi:inter-alpha-trypsin inhibitor heavy chain H3-like [Eriocheir sinensis]|uniref:inter-alpha-trypsin inhibitor heavy chain H3-like n=1 Tax=Eriocheir sinensis TaxID=95602 RepID=UPI0021C5B38A|nr:inter-alpha-trypsin inhibitor heavy chain H3-like [Eriocheir sinensis]
MRAWSPLVVVALLALLPWPYAKAGTAEGLVTDVEVEASVEHRYVVTHVATRMFNSRPEPSQLLLQMTLPKAAIVSSFVMEVGGANFSGGVSDRRAARLTYEAATQHGRTAGLLELKDNDLQQLQVRASVSGHARVTFHVTYEELLRRVNGSYRYTLHLNPGQRIPKAVVRVKVLEREAITDYKVLELPGQEMKARNPGTSVTGGPVSDGELHVLYEHQDPPGGDGRGVDGSFTLSYDITNHTDGGEVQRVGSYFAHFFSPERLPKMTTHTVFLLDVSLSMYNGKLDSMKEALNTILKDLEDEDTFEILAFSSEVVSVGTFSGAEREVKRAVRRLRRLVSLGYSNLNAALLEALKAAKMGGSEQAVKQVVVLSDGHATSGELLPAVVRENVRKANPDHYPIFVFIFNDKAKLLEDISGDSGGFARYMQRGTATPAQITDFFSEIAKPLMADVDISYPADEVDPGNVVKSGMSNYYSGGEIVVVGRLRPGINRAGPTVSARGRDGPHQLAATRMDSRDPFFASVRENYIARIWAYLMLQNLLAKAAMPENANNTQHLQTKALEIAMKFNFVSPLTSLVVVYPHDNHLLLTLPGAPHSLLGDTQPAYVTLPDSPRLGRSNRQTYVDLDPHFLVHTPGLDLPLCFNYQGRTGVSVRLLHDPQSGIVINGHVASVRQRPNIKFFSRLFLRLGPVNLTVTPEMLQVDCLGDDGSPQVDTVVKSLWPFYKQNGRKYKRHTYRKDKAAKRRRTNHHQHQRNAIHNNEVTGPDSHPRPLHAPYTHDAYYSYSNGNGSRGGARHMDHRVQDCSVNTSWEEGVGRIYGNVMVVLSKKRSLDITIGDGLAHFTIRRSRNKKGQRFLGFYIKDQEIFSPQTHGMIGQFISKRVRRMLPSKSPDIQTRAAGAGAADAPERVTLEMVRRGHRKKMSRVSGVMGSRYSLMGRTRVRCIQVHAKGTGGVLDGQPRDYLIPCLQC